MSNVKNSNALHLPAWKALNQPVGTPEEKKAMSNAASFAIMELAQNIAQFTARLLDAGPGMH